MHSVRTILSLSFYPPFTHLLSYTPSPHHLIPLPPRRCNPSLDSRKTFDQQTLTPIVLVYAYFGGASIFSDILPVTGVLQLAVGILGELYVVWRGCTGEGTLWANCLAVGLLGTYAVLFAGDLRERGKGKEGEKERVGEKVE
jgi:hypothetical protein